MSKVFSRGKRAQKIIAVFKIFEEFKLRERAEHISVPKNKTVNAEKIPS